MFRIPLIFFRVQWYGIVIYDTPVRYYKSVLLHTTYLYPNYSIYMVNIIKYDTQSNNFLILLYKLISATIFLCV